MKKLLILILLALIIGAGGYSAWTIDRSLKSHAAQATQDLKQDNALAHAQVQINTDSQVIVADTNKSNMVAEQKSAVADHYIKSHPSDDRDSSPVLKNTIRILEAGQ